jgi:hypothetical protein
MEDSRYGKNKKRKIELICKRYFPEVGGIEYSIKASYVREALIRAVLKLVGGMNNP